MRRLILAIAFCSLLLMGAQYNIPFNPQSSGGSVIFSEDCDNVSDWTDVSSGGASVDAVAGQCLGNLASNFEDASIIRGPLDSTSEFCSMRVITMNTANANKLGCIFRAPAAPGVHYEVGFNNGTGAYFIENQTDAHDFVDEVKGGTSCSCGAYRDIGASDYIGITISGTGSSTTVNWWDFVQTPPSDLQNPGTWGTATCECSAAEIVTADSLTLIDVAGDCGPEMTSEAANEITIDDFACGDTP